MAALWSFCDIDLFSILIQCWQFFDLSVDNTELTQLLMSERCTFEIDMLLFQSKIHSPLKKVN